MLGKFDGERVTFEEIYRFENQYKKNGSLFYWDADALRDHLIETLKKAKKDGIRLDCFGVDTWGVDFGLLDEKGALIGQPRSYRMAEDADMDEVWKMISKKDLFLRSGIAAISYNTIYQLYRRKLEGDEELKKAQTMLMMPDLMMYFLTGEKKSEYTEVTTSNLFNPSVKDWDFEVIKKLGLPEKIFTEIDYPGSIRGNLKKDLAEELGLPQIPCAVVGTHDTASAVAAIPMQKGAAFCSSGTWTMFGVETDTPVLSDTVYDANFAYEGTVQGGYQLLKNLDGLWIIQECRREWKEKGISLSWDDITDAAGKAKPLRSLINTEDQVFFAGGDMIEKIQEYCHQSGQPVPESVGEISRCVYESLALQYRLAVENLEKIIGKKIESLNITGGGIQNRLLNQMIADAIDRPVTTGPIEGACAGNVLMQASALGELGGLDDIRDVIRNSFPLEYYEPKHTDAWEEAYHKLKL